MTAQEYIEKFAEARGFWDPAKAAQAYVIALGVNDLYNRKMPLGTLADIYPEDYTKNEKTFLGYYGAIISRYKEISPDAKFFFVTFPNVPNPDREDITRRMIDSLYALTEIFDNSYVIDLHQYGPVYDAEFKKNFFMFGHMNPMGYIVTARLIDSYIDYIVRHRPDDFKTVGFVGTDIRYRW